MAYIPRPVRKVLRKEVAFGCPVRGCGSAYLSYHHFDPPLAIKKHNNPEGMIALCLPHHKSADQGAFSKSQLRMMKECPYLVETGELPQGSFAWKRERLFLLAGNNSISARDTLLTHGGQKILWLSRDKDNNELLNLDFYDSDGQIIVQMQDNDWTVNVPLDDINCSASGHRLNLRAPRHEVHMNIHFRSLAAGKFLEIMEKRGRKELPEAFREFIRTDEVVLCTIRARLAWPYLVTITRGVIHQEANHIYISGLQCFGSRGGISI